jgi:peptidoglycan/LPS O-acetylase OafA/YrhL
VPRKTAEILAGLRARARPRDLLARLRVLLLAFGLLNVAGIFPILLFSRSDPPFWILGVVAPAALALAWLHAYRNGYMGPDRLRTLNCDIGQGYLFSRPLPADAVTHLLRDSAAMERSRANAA